MVSTSYRYERENREGEREGEKRKKRLEKMRDVAKKFRKGMAINDRTPAMAGYVVEWRRPVNDDMILF